MFLKFRHIHRETRVLESVFNEVKKRSSTGVSCEYGEIFRNIFFIEYLWLLLEFYNFGGSQPISYRYFLITLVIPNPFRIGIFCSEPSQGCKMQFARKCLSILIVWLGSECACILQQLLEKVVFLVISWWTPNESRGTCQLFCNQNQMIGFCISGTFMLDVLYLFAVVLQKSFSENFRLFIGNHPWLILFKIFMQLQIFLYKRGPPQMFFSKLFEILKWVVFHNISRRLLRKNLY